MWCITECWDCEDRKCGHYISKAELYFENQRLKNQLRQKENIVKEYKKLLEKIYKVLPGTYNQLLIEIKQILG